MVVGVGVDMVKIDKIKRAIDRWGQSFLDRVYDQRELAHIREGKMYYQRLAARFAAKEAVIKATSGQYQLTLKDIIIRNKENGAPYCELSHDVGLDIFLSLTHIQDYAVACAVAQKTM